MTRRTIFAGLLGLAVALTGTSPGGAAPLDEITADLRGRRVLRSEVGHLQNGVTGSCHGLLRRVHVGLASGEVAQF